VPLRVVRTTSEDQVGVLHRIQSEGSAAALGTDPPAHAGAESAADPGADLAVDAVPAPADAVPEALVNALPKAPADVAFVRLPVDDTSLSIIPLYEEAAYVVVPKDHPASALDSLTLADLEGEEMLGGSWASAIELVGANVGVVIVPQSIARLNARGDVVARPVTDGPATRICLVWPADRTTDHVETFVGIVRGRGVRSSRSPGADDEARATARPRETRKAAPSKGASAKGAAAASTGGKPSGRAQRQSAAEARAAANRRKRTRGA